MIEFIESLQGTPYPVILLVAGLLLILLGLGVVYKEISVSSAYRKTSLFIGIVFSVISVGIYIFPVNGVVNGTDEENRAVQFLEEYFESINNAGNTLDIEELWDYLDEDFRKNSSKGGIKEFKDFWWSVRVKYQLFDCERNIVDIQLTYYDRGDEAFFTELDDDFIRYTLEIRNEQWIIVDGETIEGSNCEPYN